MIVNYFTMKQTEDIDYVMILLNGLKLKRFLDENGQETINLDNAKKLKYEQGLTVIGIVNDYKMLFNIRPLAALIPVRDIQEIWENEETEDKK